MNAEVPIMTEQTKSAMQKFRRVNQRIDYYPVPDAVAAIERLKQSRPGVSTREIIDMLVVEGIAAWFPERNPVTRTDKTSSSMKVKPVPRT